jgi:hypothetical protein
LGGEGRLIKWGQREVGTAKRLANGERLGLTIRHGPGGDAAGVGGVAVEAGGAGEGGRRFAGFLRGGIFTTAADPSGDPETSAASPPYRRFIYRGFPYRGFHSWGFHH